MSSTKEDFSSTCRREIQDFVKCTKEKLRTPSSGSERGDITDCLPVAQHYADCIQTNKLIPRSERSGADQKLAPPPVCEMESSVYGQCMANLLDNEVRRRRREDGGDVSGIELDASKCKFMLGAYEKCLKANPDATTDSQTTANAAPTYYWMSSIYWQAPSKKD